MSPWSKFETRLIKLQEFDTEAQRDDLSISSTHCKKRGIKLRRLQNMQINDDAYAGRGKVLQLHAFLISRVSGTDSC